jgi:hypothetical protein
VNALAPPKEKPRTLASETGRKTDKPQYRNCQIRQGWRRQIASVTRQRLAKLKRCRGLADPERHAVRFLLRRKRFRILEKDLINRLYAEHLEGMS